MKKTTLVIVLIIVVVALMAWWQFGSQKTEPTLTEDNTPTEDKTPTSADNAPPGSMHNLPVPGAVSSVRYFVAKDLSIEEGLVIVMSAHEREWSNSCLGLVRTNESCLQVITPGYEVTVRAQGAQRTYRTNADGTVLRQEY